VEPFATPAVAESPERGAGAAACGAAGSRRAGRVRASVRPNDDDLVVTSNLTSTAPVTDAEIALVLAVLGDRLATVLNPDPVPCPTSAPTEAA